MTELDRVYFDNSATTPLDPRVVREMLPFFAGTFGNPSSLHRSGRVARQAVEHARGQVAELLHASPEEIVFTSCGTESDNIALLTAAPGGHIITSAIEHPAIHSMCRYLQNMGVDVTCLPVDSEGIVDPDDLLKAMRPNTRLVSIMAANNVVGTIQPIVELGRIAHDHGALFHTDAVQSFGKIPFDLANQPIDLLSLSAHKVYGPKGIGALYVRKGIEVGPVIRGGGQERDISSGTENVAGIVGLGKAAEIAREEMSDDASRLVGLRDKIIDTVTETIPGSYLVGHRYRRLPGHICFGFAGKEGEAIRFLLSLDDAGFEISSGSACSSNHASEPSYILLAMGFDPIRARGSLRITLGRFNTETEVDRFLGVLPEVVCGAVAAR